MSHEGVKFDTERLFIDLQEGLDRFADDFPLEEFKKGDYEQYPAITLLACSDSRVPGTMVGPLFNRVFSVESIGNQVRTAEGSVLYGLLHLHTPIMIVSGHSDCGALKAASADYSAEPAALKQELDIVKKSMDEGIKLFTGQLAEEEKIRFTQLAELNVDVQVNYLLSNPEVRELVDRKKLVILGLILDLHNVYGEGYGKTYTCSINGETSVDRIKTYVGAGSIAQHVRRLT